jgi:hypothetical protein
VISARTAQGYEEFKASTLQERQAIVIRWSELEAENLKSSQDKGRVRSDSHGSRNASPRRFFHARQLSLEKKKRQYEERKAKREAERNKIQCQDGKSSCPFCRRVNPHAHTPGVIDTTKSERRPSDAISEFEEAIQASVAATSRGDPEQDAMIERAIRASIRELQNDSGTTTSNHEAINRAIQASILAAGRYTAQGSSTTESDTNYQPMLAKSIRDSLASYEDHRAAKDIYTADEKSQRSLLASKETNVGRVDSDEDEDLKLAIRRSKEEHEKSSTEEEIVMRYIKKQSLIEDELRSKRLEYQRKQSQKLQGGVQSDAEEESAADEEALQLAIKESLKTTGGGSSPGAG